MNIKAILLSATGITTLFGIGLTSFWISEAKDIKDFLIYEGKTLLDTKTNKNNSEWKILLAEHKKSKSLINGSEISKLSINNFGDDDNEGVAKLKIECNNLFEKTLSNNENWKIQKNNATNWCTLESPIIKGRRN